MASAYSVPHPPVGAASSGVMCYPFRSFTGVRLRCRCPSLDLPLPHYEKHHKTTMVKKNELPENEFFLESQSTEIIFLMSKECVSPLHPRFEFLKIPTLTHCLLFSPPPIGKFFPQLWELELELELHTIRPRHLLSQFCMGWRAESPILLQHHC